MSRSRKKVAIMGIAYGSNTKFYRAANRKLRTVKKRILKMFLLGRLSEEDISFPAHRKESENYLSVLTHMGDRLTIIVISAVFVHKGHSEDKNLSAFL